MVICVERGADCLYVVQSMPLPLVSDKMNVKPCLLAQYDFLCTLLYIFLNNCLEKKVVGSNLILCTDCHKLLPNDCCMKCSRLPHHFLQMSYCTCVDNLMQP